MKQIISSAIDVRNIHATITKTTLKRNDRVEPDGTQSVLVEEVTQ